MKVTAVGLENIGLARSLGSFLFVSGRLPILIGFRSTRVFEGRQARRALKTDSSPMLSL